MSFAGGFPGTERFRIVRELGAGAMGVVYEAEDREADSRVALKVLHRLDPEAIGRFKAEFRSLQTLAHGGVVSFGELFEHGGDWFFTMELVHGQPLLDHARPDGVLDIARLTAALDQLIEAVAAVHTAGKVHRDLKPSNVLVTDAGRVVLLDFGMVADRSGTGSWTGDGVVGTAVYVAPEQTEHQRATPGADWYAVGVLLYEALTGRGPHGGNAFEIILAKRRGDAIVAPSAIAAGVPAVLERLCLALLDGDPERRTAAIEAYRGRHASPSRAPRPTESLTRQPVFVGRRAELASLRAAAERSRLGGVEIVRIVGESGIGKTALLRRALDEITAIEPRTLVLQSRCHEGESVPFNACDGLIDALARYLRRVPEVEAATLVPARVELLTRVFPVLRRVPVLAAAPVVDVVDPQVLRTRMFAVLRELIHALGERRPLVLTIDDVQWADDDSALLLAALVRSPDPPPLLLVLVGRLDARTGANRLASLAVRAATMVLEPLPADDATALAREMLAGSADASATRAAALAAEANGHPQYLDELIRFAGAGAGRQVHLDDVLAARVHALEPGARRVLELIAVAGYPLPRDLVAAASELDGRELQRELAVLRIGAFARTAGARASDTVEPYHDRIRRAVLRELDESTRRAHHQALADALAGRADSDPERLAIHLEAAGRPRDAAGFAVRAALGARRALAFDRAARWYRVAMELYGDDPLGEPLRVELGDTLAAAGRGFEAAEVYLAARPGTDVALALDLRRRAAEQQLVSGHIAAGLATVTDVLTREQMSYPLTAGAALRGIVWNRMRLAFALPRLRLRDIGEITPRALARVDLCWNVTLALGMVDSLRGQLFHTRGMLLALRAGEPYRLSRALTIEAAFVSIGGSAVAARVRDLLDRAEGLSKIADHPHARAFLTTARGHSAFLAGEFRAAIDWSALAETQLRDECTGVTWELATARLWLSRALMYEGRFAELGRRLPMMLHDCDERGDLYGGTTLRASVAPFVRLADDDPEGAETEALAARRAWTATGYHVQHYYAAIGEISARLYRGDLAEAEARLVDVWRGLRASMLRRVQFIRIVTLDLEGRIVLAATRGADRARLARVAGIAARLEREGAAWAQPLAAALRAGIAG
ncbi:MAG: AAA family ATPase, partial [Deltaproteobacteria bacterium]|nr:AAA family ATPase [Deltaproteobacteria bacterium]